MKGLPALVFLLVVLSNGTAAAAVRYVDPSHAAARDAGDGGASQPYKSLAHAMKQLQPGDTLNLAAGTYREALQFPARNWSGGPTVIQPAGGAAVLVKGSDIITGWERLANGLHVKRPWTVNSQQVFVDGVALQQIGGAIYGGYPDKPGHPMAKLHAGKQGGVWPGRVPGGLHDMPDNSFFYDGGAQSLYLKGPFPSLEGRTVEVSVRPHLVFGERLEGITLKNIRFQHANTTALNQSGAVTLLGRRLVLEKIEVTYVDGSGFDITGDEIVIRDSRANHCGQVGMKVRGRGNRLLGNETSFNNTRGFNKWWEAGGAKFVGDGGLRDSEVSGHRAIGNNGDGIWFDWMNSNNRIHGSVAAYNTGFGIHYEASQRAFIFNNYVFGNRQRGIYLPHSSESVIAYNLVARNGMEGIAVIDEGRSKNKPELRPRGNRVFGNILAWNAKAALVLPAGLLENVSDYNLLLAAREPPAFSLGWGSRESPVRKGLADWRAASGQDAHSWSEALDVPQALLEALERRHTDPDWTQLMVLAARHDVDASRALNGVAASNLVHQPSPGPKR
jgi:parallel beta-helix repeat protein